MRPTLVSLLVLALAGAGCASAVDQELLASVPSAPHTSESWEYEDCGLPTDVIQIQSIEVSPDPPKPGAPLTVTVVGVALDDIEDGAYADVVVKVGMIQLLKKTFDVCEEAANANASVTCPVEKGLYTVTQTVDLPKEIPKAKFTVAVRGYTVDDEDMVCLNLNVDFRAKRPFFKAW